MSQCDVLLINPPWLTRDGNIWHGVKSTWPPLGLLYIAAMMELRGHSVAVIDATAERLGLEDLRERITKYQPRFIGLTAVTSQINSAHRIASLASEISPDSVVVIGGVHATAMPEEVLADLQVDYVVRGEGEQSMLALVEGQPPEGIVGLSRRDPETAGAFLHNPAEVIRDLDALPMPAYHLINMKLYKPAVGSYRRLPAMAMLTSRGCPGKCIFCNSAQVPLRVRSADHVIVEMEKLYHQYGIREISFYDDTFTVRHENVMRLCELMQERGLDISWSCFARTDCVSPALLAKMKAAGCHQVLLGLESADPQILKNIRKPIDLQRTREAVAMVRKAGIAVRAAFMFGNPGETMETMRCTIDFAKQLKPDIALFNVATPYPGTEMFNWAKEKGYLRTVDWNDYDLANAVVDLPTASREQINVMYRQAYREFYFRPSYMVSRLLRLRSWEDIKMNLQALRSVWSTD